jgi:hypothetical protein
MTDVSKNLVSKLIDEIGLLIDSRIAAYINKHADGSKASFLNQFLVFPEYDDFNPSLLKNAMEVRQEFDNFVSNDLVSVTLTEVATDDDLELSFYLDIYPTFIDEDQDCITASLKSGKLMVINNELQEQLEGFGDDHLSQFTTKLRNFRTLSTLKDS